QTINLPDPNSANLDCKPSGDPTNQITNLDSCLNQLIHDKNPTQVLQIYLEPGNYVLDNSVFIFQRDYIQIFGKTGAPFTKIYLSRRLSSLGGEAPFDQYFTFSIIDSSYITFRGLGLIGPGIYNNSNYAQRAIAVCPTNNNRVSGISIDGNI